jgi:predicted transcriptional regulator
VSLESIENIEGQKGALRLLIYLNKVGKANMQRIVNETNLYARIVKSSTTLLEKEGLVSTNIDHNSYPPKNMVSLTDKGKRIAEKMKEINDILGSD